MRLGIDGRGAILYRGTGIGTYTWRLLAGLEKEKDCSIFLPGDELGTLSFGDASVLEIQGRQSLWEDVFLPQAIKNKEIELYHVPQNGIGLPRSKQCKETVTIHDMIPYIFPETVGKGYLKEFLGKMPKILDDCDGIITVSQSSKKDITDIFDYPEDQIAVIAEAPEPIFQPMKKEEAKKILAAYYDIFEDYFLYVGGFGMRKNVKALVLAYYLLRKEENIQWHLVLPGKRTAEFDRLDTMIEALGLKKYVHLCGYVPVCDLPYFYSGASAMVYPSIYEGFGLPPLEAMAAGCPVISSNASSLPEVLGDAPLYFNPFDTIALAEEMQVLYCDEEKRNVLSEKALKRAKLFSWDKTVNETKTFFEKVYSE